jgi:hypothetical protein
MAPGSKSGRPWTPIVVIGCPEQDSTKLFSNLLKGLYNGKCSDSSSQYLKIKIWKSCRLSPYIPLLKQLYWFSFEQPITNFCSHGLHGFYSMAPGSKSGRPWTPIVVIGCPEQDSTKLFSNLLKGLYNGKCSDSSSQYLKIKIWKSCQLSPHIPLLKQLYWFSFEQPITIFCSHGLHGFYSMAPGSKSGRPWTLIVMIGCPEQDSTKLFSNLSKGLYSGKCSDSSSQYLKIKIWKSCQLSPHIPLLKQLYWFSFEQPITTFCSHGLHGFYYMAPGSKSGRPWAPLTHDWLSRTGVNKVVFQPLKTLRIYLEVM